MQQTRVEQGLPYYNKFVNKYKNVKAFANANESEILKLWQGLGYYSRARNMHTAAKQIVELHKGVFPANYDELLKLKGVGEYTASAIASIAYGLPHAVCDGNVFRVLSRLYANDTPINSTEGKKSIFPFSTVFIESPFSIATQSSHDGTWCSCLQTHKPIVWAMSYKHLLCSASKKYYL